MDITYRNLLQTNNNKFMDIDAHNSNTKSHHSHHSLKGSYIFENQGAVHLNPASGRIGLTKKHSLNAKQQKINYESLNVKTNNNQIRFDKGYHLNIQQPPQNIVIQKQDNFISLGCRGRQTTRQYNTGILQNTSQTDKKIVQVSRKLDWVVLQLQSFDNRLKKIQQVKSNKQVNDSPKIQFIEAVQNMKNQSKTLQQKFDISKQNMNRQFDIIKKQIDKLSQKLKQQSIKTQEKLQTVETIFKQTVINTKNSLFSQLLQIEKKFQKRQKKNYQLVRSEITDKLTQLSDKKTDKHINLNLKQAPNINNPENQSIQNFGKLSSALNYNVDLLSNNPYLRLKFLGKLTLMGVSADNPQKQIAIQSVDMIYKIDKQGFLLDENNKYIINSQNKMVRLDDKQIRILEDNHILKI